MLFYWPRWERIVRFLISLCAGILKSTRLVAGHGFRIDIDVWILRIPVIPGGPRGSLLPQT